MNQERDVTLFMKKGEQSIAEFPHLMPDVKLLAFRHSLITEEMISELNVAFGKCMKSWSTENVAELVDGIIDSMYVLIGTLVAFGLPIEEAWNEVQRANMDKFRNGLIKNEAGKVQKPEGWTAPDIWSIVNECFANSQSRWNHARPFRSPNQDGK